MISPIKEALSTTQQVPMHEFKIPKLTSSMSTEKMRSKIAGGYIRLKKFEHSVLNQQ